MYLPKSQIVENKYTNGQDFSRSDDGSDYVGFYWLDSKGRAFSGKNPTDLPSISLLPQIEESGEEAPDPLSNSSSWVTDYDPKITSKTPGVVPQRYIPKPTEDNYDIGEFQRYFTKKTNQNIYFEISEKDFKDLNNKNKRLQWQLYQGISLPWQISGDKELVYTTNKNIVRQTEEQQRLPGFSRIFREDYLQYYKK